MGSADQARELVLMGNSGLTVLIIGTGSIGRRHIRNLRSIDPECRFVLLREGARSDAFSSEIGAQVVASLPEALLLGVDLAVVASPSDQHAIVLLPLLYAGVPTFIEKPVVIDMRDVEAIAQIAGNAPTQVGCVLRFLPSLRQMRNWIDEGRLGRVVRSSFEVGQYLPDWRPAQDYRASYSADSERGGGVVFDLIHEIDLACWLLGDRLTLAGAWGGQLSHLDVRSEDVATIVLLAADGAQAAIQLDYVSRTPVRRLTIVGDQGTASWSLSTRELTLHGEGGLLDRVTDGFDTSEAYLASMLELVEAARSGTPTSLPLSVGLPATRLAIAANAMIRSRPSINAETL